MSGAASPSPEDALARARERAAELRARGGYGDDGADLDLAPSARINDWRITEWAIIDPERAEVYSTRRFGAPITLLKRLLLRVLRQYHGEILAQQSRFNAHVAAHLLSLDDRLRRLEELAGVEPPPESQRRPPA